jgi:hypothetical protein
LIFRLLRVFYWLIESLSHFLSFASLFLCCLIILRIKTISKMSFFINSTAAFKGTVILKELDNWDEWIEIVKTMIKRDDVERYVNLIKIESVESIELDLFIFFTIKIDAITSNNLSIDKQRNLAIFREDYKSQMCKYKKKANVSKSLNIFILTLIDRFNLIYLRNQKTFYQKLSIFKKRLASTNRSRKFEMIRKYKDLSKALKH